MTKQEYQRMLKFYMFNEHLSDGAASLLIKNLIERYKHQLVK